ncbi:MAG: HD domain-containing protein [Sulfuritalea sp.]|nr:HD domain-containing protein [Sulfuritalea sp.]
MAFAPIRESFNELSFRIDDSNLSTRAEQLRVRLKTYPILVASQALLQLLFVFVLWNQSEHRLLLLWIACTYVFHAWEMIKWHNDRDALHTTTDCRLWSRHFTLLALGVGLLWGSAFMYFFPPGLEQQLLLICLMLALAAGSVTMISVHSPSTYAYLFGVMLPLTFRVMAVDDEPHRAIAYMLMVFLVVIVAAGRELQKLIFISLNQRFENLALVKQLTHQKGLLEQANREVEESNELLRDKGKLLEKLVQERTNELLAKTVEVVAIQDVMIMAMCSLSEARDNETGNHIKRTQHYVRELAQQLQQHARFSDFLSDEIVEALYKVAPLHDIGKVGIPDAILLKPGKLTAEEFEIMKTHTTLGGNAIAYSGEDSRLQDNSYLVLAREIATGHHEKWDGSGYPKGLLADQIPISARLMAVADVYDALISRRIYKEGFTHERATEFIVDGRGKHFDPDVVDAFLAIQPAFQRVAMEYHD